MPVYLICLVRLLFKKTKLIVLALIVFCPPSLFPVCCIPAGPHWLSRDPLTCLPVLYDCRLSGIRLRWKDSLTNPATSLNSWREEWPLKMSLTDTSASRLWSVQLTGPLIASGCAGRNSQNASDSCHDTVISTFICFIWLLAVGSRLDEVLAVWPVALFTQSPPCVLRWRRVRLWWATLVPWCGSMCAGRA